MKKQFVRLALAAVALAGAPVLLSPSVLAQAISVNGGSIGGTITDPSGAAVSGASVSILSTETGFKKDLTTDKAGYYLVGPLNPGKYTVSVTSAGFQTTTVSTVVRTGTATAGNVKLAIGQSTTEISVSAGDVQVNTDQVSVGGVITKQQIDALPVNGRNFLDLAQIEPGVILQSGESFDPTKAGYSAISVGGVSGRTTRILLDGQDITDETVGTTIFNVSQGAVGEFQLNRSNSDVSGDVTSTGLVLVSTNSGTNSLHGQVFYNFQDHRAGYALTKNGVDVPFQRNQFGLSVGGPIIKDKLFFFGNSERIKQDSAAASSVLTGSSALFSQVAAAYPSVTNPYRETYSTIRLDYNGPFGGHYFVRGNYNVNSVASNGGDGYWLYSNRDNTPGIAGGADFATGRFTHSFRVSYEKFHNRIADATASSSSLYNPIPNFAFYNSAQGLYAGPNYLAPQGTFQSDKQVRYDGSWTHGSHNVRFGYSLNRILGGGFASFFGLTPRASESASTVLATCTTTQAACKNDPLNGYHVGTVYIGNGQGYFTENSGFNLPGGGVGDWRSGAYVSDNWKITPSFTLVAGVRWSVDTGRANQDINLPTCADLDASAFASGTNPCSGLAGTTELTSLWQSNLTQTRVHQPWTNFGPQVGFNYAPGNHKTVLSAGFGIYYEGDVFNNTTNARTALLKSGAFFDDRTPCSGNYSVTIPGSSTPVTSVTVGGTTQSLQSICTTLSVAQAAPYLVQLQNQYQSATKANATLANGGYLGETLNAGGMYAQPYRTPYSQQFNAGIQREVFKNATLSANYIHQSTIKIPLATDLNHIGAARYLNSAAATAAIAATAQAFGCSGAGTAQVNAQCAITNGAMIGDFASNGLDGGANYFGGYPAGAYGATPATGAAFPGANPLLGNGGMLLPRGRSGYDALQVVFRENVTRPAPGIQAANLQVSYNLSRAMAVGGAGSDQFFSSNAIDNDNPLQFMGRNNLDHTNQVNFGGSATLKYGPRIGFIGHFYSAAPSTLTLDSTVSDGTANGGIFLSDITGDGTTGDVAPNTSVGGYMHGIKPKNFNNYVSAFNGTYAGTLTPAGKALVAAGLVSNAQMTAMGATIQPIATPASANPIANPAFRSLDVNFAYPIRFNRLREGLSLEPSVNMYNVANFSNFSAGSSGTLINPTTAGGATVTSAGYLQSPNTYAAQNNYRTQRGSGTFSVGAPRTTEFQLKLNF